MRKIICLSFVLSTNMVLASCYMDEGHDTPEADYSSRHVPMTIVAENGRTKHGLVPEACLSQSADGTIDGKPKRLPPGCANNYNRQLMVERKRDLRRGRRLTAAPAAPAAHAARSYLDGEQHKPVMGGGVRESGGGGSGQTTNEPVVR
jgi:hypothetical protein